MAEVITNPTTQNPISSLARALLQANRLTMAQIDPILKRRKLTKCCLSMRYCKVT